jgi:predicted NBD/HSP70 family sugar kinase
MAVADAAGVRRANRGRMLAELGGGGALSRSELARRLDLSLMAVMRIAQELVEVGLVCERAPALRSDLPGRPPAELALNPSGAYVLGFTFHAFEQSLALMDLTGRVLSRVPIHLSDIGQDKPSLKEAADQARSQIRALRIDPARVLGAGVAVTGTVDTARGVLIESPYLGWSGLDIAEALTARLAMPVIVEGTSQSLLAAEARRARATLRNAALFNIGFAIGGGFLVDGRIARGASFQAGQIAHMPVAEPNRICSCGRHGCLNTVGSGWAALADLGLVDGNVVSPASFREKRAELAQLLQREQEGDAEACRALRQAGTMVGRAVRQLHAVLDLARIFLAGPVGHTLSFIEGVREGSGSAAAGLIERCERELHAAAAALAMDEFVLSPQLDFDRLRRTRTRGRRWNSMAQRQKLAAAS